MTVSYCNPCQTLECALPSDFAYNNQTLPPVELPTIIPATIANSAVYYPVECASGETLTYGGTLPSWISIDTANSRLVGAGGSFLGVTLAAANAIAQGALDKFGDAAVAAGDLTCAGGGVIDWNDLVWLGTDNSFIGTGAGTISGLGNTVNSDSQSNIPGNTGQATLIIYSDALSLTTAAQNIKVIADVSGYLSVPYLIEGYISTVPYAGYPPASFLAQFSQAIPANGTYEFPLTLAGPATVYVVLYVGTAYVLIPGPSSGAYTDFQIINV